MIARNAFFGSLLLLAATSTVAIGANWQRESSDSWTWVDMDSIRQNGNLTVYTSGIGCNGSGGMPERGEEGYVSPAQCMFGTPSSNAFDCASGDVYEYKDGSLEKVTFNPSGYNTIFRMVCGHERQTDNPAPAPAPSRAEQNWLSLADAVGKGDAKTVSAMLALGVSPDTPHPDYEDRYSPFSVALCTGHLDLAKLLLAHHADVNNVENVGGYTPLMIVANCGKPAAITFLLRAKARINLKSKAGETALDWALKKNDAAHRKVAQILLSHGAASGKN